MDLGYGGRVALVTGATSGVGRAAALELAAQGARVGLTYATHAAEAEHVVEQIAATGGEAVAVPLRLEDTGSIRAAVAAVVTAWGHLDIVVCNAVRWERRMPTSRLAPDHFVDEDWRTFLRANVEGIVDLISEVVPLLRASDAGRLTFVSSSVAEEGMGGGALIYAAAKAALHGLARSLAWDLGRDGVLVNVLALGMTATQHSLDGFPRSVRDQIAATSMLGRLSAAEDVATWLVFVSSPRNRSITGEIFHDGTATARSANGTLHQRQARPGA
jgi:3-oxoacyl-[acyl-carrier protein] reductase